MIKEIIVDGNEATAKSAYAFSEIAAIYPITPASSMGELVDEWSNYNHKNIFGKPLKVIEMQSEAGAAGALHGVLSGGSLGTTFTASQGLLLMLPNMFKIAGEMLPTVIHVAARSLAYQSLSIFGDHSDVMSTRTTGFAMLSSSSVQEAHDLATIAHLSSLESRIPFLHFFDGFRTSHEIQKIELIDYKKFKLKGLKEFQNLALNPNTPKAKVGAQNPDVYFQGRERSNQHYFDLPKIVKKQMDDFYKITGRKYEPFEYYGSKTADKLIIIMGSGADTVKETVKEIKNVGVINVKLYRPFSVEDFIKKIPKTVKKIAVLDRTKECGAIGEPLYLDVVAALQGSKIKIIGGRYGLSSKEFNPTMVKAVFDHLDKKCTHNFTVGINDDLTNLSLKLDNFVLKEKSYNCKFWGLGSDGTVSASKNNLKIVGQNKYVQGYFAYDSRKSGGITQSYLRFDNKKINKPYLPQEYDFIAIHNTSFIGKYCLLEGIKEKGTILINSPYDNIFEHLSKEMQDIIITKKINLYNINAHQIAQKIGLKQKINTIMQTCFLHLSKLVPQPEKLIKKEIEKTFSKKGPEIVKMNYNAVDQAIKNLQKVNIKKTTKHSKIDYLKISIPELKQMNKEQIQFVKDIVVPSLRLEGDTIPVSKMPLDGMIPTGTTKIEKRGLSTKVPHWIPEKCIMCGMCSAVCPHGAIRTKQINDNKLVNKNGFRVQIYPLDCTGCNACVSKCPTGALVMMEVDEKEIENARYFDKLESSLKNDFTIKGTQLKPTYFEFSGACSGCGETPYIKMLTSMFGERLIIANATGCSSIFGGTFPSIPYTIDHNGKGPAWANSLFEDNAEYALGIRMALDYQGDKEKTVWAVGGDGWAYDIGFGGLDHVVASGKNVNILVLDTEVYSNTGGQASKATPLGAVAKFASAGKEVSKKNLGKMLSCYNNVYVAYVNFGANVQHVIKCFKEAEEHQGPSIIIAYAGCISHGINMNKNLDIENLATKSGYWPLLRYVNGDVKLDSQKSIEFKEYIKEEKRYMMLNNTFPERAKLLQKKAEDEVNKK
jgi:pyruvate-ferredoxin/flavodoxin oxidoreductase